MSDRPRRARLSVRTLLLVTLAVAALASSGLLAITSTIDFRQTVREGSLDARDAAARASEAIERAITEVKGGVTAIAASGGFVPIFQAQAACDLQAAGSGPFASGHIDVVRPSGAVFCSSIRTVPGATYRSAPWLTGALRSDEVVVAEMQRGPSTGESELVIAARIATAGRTLGVVIYALQSDAVASSLGAQLGGRHDHSFTIFSGGDVVSGDALATEPEPAASEVRSDDGSLVVGTARAPSTGWLVVASMPKDRVVAVARDRLLAQAWTGVGLLLMLGLFGGFLYTRFARPLRTLRVAVEQAGRDVQPASIPPQGPQEIVEVLEGFNQMVAARAETEEQLIHQSLHDALTGLPNRVLLLDRLGHALARAPREGTMVGVLLLDIDRFRRVNEGLGREEGDRLLVQVAARIGGTVRPGDTVARLAGDEFVVVCESVTDERDARGLGDRLSAAMAEPFDGAEKVVLTAAIGIAIDSGATDAHELLRNADSAMVRAKRDQAARVQLYRADARERAVERFALEADLRRALERDELHVHYQPIVDLTSRRVIEVEALVRWDHPRLGLLEPARFISLAEETGLIVELGRAVLRQGIRDLTEWRALGIDVAMSINVSSRQLRHDGFVDELRSAIGGVDPRALCLEVTESAALERGARERLQAIRAIGICVAIDDFGTGYSSLSYLNELPIDRVKIDRAFVAQISTGDRSIVRAILQIARARRLTTVAEGIEEATQLDALSALGCSVGQGYLFGRAEPETAIRARLLEQRLAAAN